MRLLSFIVVCFSLAVSSRAQTDTIKIEKLQANGKIQTLKELTFKAIDRNGTLAKGKMCEDVFASDNKDRNTNHSYSFDRNGNQTRQIEFWDPTNVKSDKTYVYLNGKIVESNKKMVFSDRSITIKEIYKYSNDRLTTLTVYRNGSLLTKQVYEYDDKGTLIAENEINSEGGFSRKQSFKERYSGDKLVYSETNDSEYGIDISEYKYDSIGRVSVEKFNFGDTYIRTIKYTYNAMNQPTSIYQADEQGVFLGETLYDYDSSGKIINENLTWRDNQKSSIKYSYHGNMKTEVHNTLTGNLEKRTYQDNNIVELEKEGSKYTYKYTFDSHSNWTRIVEYKNTIPTLIRERTILYYQ